MTKQPEHLSTILEGDVGIAPEYGHMSKRVMPSEMIEPAGAALNDFYFLIVCTWRGSNEVWETVFYKDGDAMVDFALFAREKTHKPTFCVWELAPVWHEQQAWVRFLNSARDEAAAQAWLGDCYAGSA